ncbi:MAG: ADP-ribosylglycohydrolase family protein [Fimbriimonadaceae bacterium]|nr:ADP-ribosylglycohydrolase family protein [Fimbriimonadaceae bacterium]
MKPENLRSAVMGAVVGATLGAPFRGQNQFRKLNYYEPIPTRMAPSEALDAWVVWIQHLRRGLPPEAISASIFASWLYTTHESAFGLANLGRGLDSPMAGTFQNPLAPGAQALGRAAFWGLALSGDPERAFRYAYFDAANDHDSVGVASALAVMAMTLTAGPGVNATTLVKAAKDALPGGHPAHKAIARLLQCFNEGKDAATTYDLLPATLPTQDPHYAPFNLALILHALLYGQGDFGASVRIAAGSGGASDQTALVVGAILGASTIIDAEWTDPLGSPYVAGHGLRAVDPPASLAEFADWVVSVSEGSDEDFLVPESVPASVEAAAIPPSGRPVVVPDVEVEVESVEPTEHTEPTEPGEPTDTLTVVEDPNPLASIAAEVALPKVAVPKDLLAALDKPADTGFVAIGDLRISAQYIDPPTVVPGKTNRFVLTFKNEGLEERVLEPHLSVPAGWSAAHKLSSFRVRHGEQSQFPIVVQAPSGELAPVTNVRIELGGQDVLIPLLAGQPWYWVGPFVNHDGASFEKAMRAEDVQKTGDTFNGRSDLPIKWTREWCEGVIFDLEPKFNNGAGVVYLWAKVRLGEAGKYRLVVATPVGARAWVDKKELIRYHDVHTPIPRAIQPYVAEFDCGGEAEILIKILRNRDPISPTVIYFLAEDGRHVEPFGFAEMPV